MRCYKLQGLSLISVLPFVAYSDVDVIAILFIFYFIFFSY